METTIAVDSPPSMQRRAEYCLPPLLQAMVTSVVAAALEDRLSSRLSALSSSIEDCRETARAAAARAREAGEAGAEARGVSSSAHAVAKEAMEVAREAARGLQAMEATGAGGGRGAWEGVERRMGAVERRTEEVGERLREAERAAREKGEGAFDGAVRRELEEAVRREVGKAGEEQRAVLDVVVTDVAKAIRERHGEAMRRVEGVERRVDEMAERVVGTEALGTRVALVEERLGRMVRRNGVGMSSLDQSAISQV